MEYNILQDIIVDYFAIAISLPKNPAVSAALEATVIWLVITALGTLSAMYAWLFLVVGLVIAIIYWQVRSGNKTAEFNRMLDQIEKARPNFKEFYKAWLVQNSPSADEIMSGIMGAGIGLVGVGLAVYEAYKIQRLYDDVHAIRRNLDS